MKIIIDLPEDEMTETEIGEAILIASKYFKNVKIVDDNSNEDS